MSVSRGGEVDQRDTEDRIEDKGLKRKAIDHHHHHRHIDGPPRIDDALNDREDKHTHTAHNTDQNAVSKRSKRNRSNTELSTLPSHTGPSFLTKMEGHPSFPRVSEVSCEVKVNTASDHPPASAAGSWILGLLSAPPMSASSSSTTSGPRSATPSTQSSRSALHTPSTSISSTESPTTSYVTGSGAILNLSNCGFVLSAYLQSFGTDPAHFRSTQTYSLVPPLVPTVRTAIKPRESHQPPPDHLFHCTITLPAPCPLNTMTSPGRGFRSKDLAKKHATIELVWALVCKGEIGEDLKPTQRKKAHKRDKHYEKVAEHVHRKFAGPSRSSPDLDLKKEKINSFKKAMIDRLPSSTPPSQVVPGIAEYPHITHAAFWDGCPLLTCSELWPTLIELRLGGDFTERTGECRVMCMLTSRPLPIFPDGNECFFDLTLPSVGIAQQEVKASVRLVKGNKMKTWDEGKLDKVMAYNLRLVRAHINKPAEGTLETTKWLVAPMQRGYSVKEGRLNVKRHHIAWNEIEAGLGPIWSSFSYNDPAKLAEEVKDAMTTPRYEFSRRFYITNIRSDLTPFSPNPNDSSQTIMESFATPFESTVSDQPIIEGEQVYGIRYGGFIASLPNPKLKGKFAIPEITQKHCISASVFKTTSALPAALQALDDLLVATEFSTEIFHSSLTPSLSLTALTCPTTHGTRAGKTYERLEMLGDTLLKFLVAVYLLFRGDESEIDWDEIHQERQIMVSNRTLQSFAIKSGVVPYIRGASAKGKEWLPMGWWPLEQAANEEKAKKSAPEPERRSSTEDGEAGIKDPANEEQSAKTARNVFDSEQGRSDGNAQEADGSVYEALSAADPIHLPPSDTSIPSTNRSLQNDITLSSTGVKPSNPTKGGPLDRMGSAAWGTKRSRADDSTFQKQSLGDKTVADVAEALIAANYLSNDSHIDAAISALRNLHMDFTGFTKWEDVVSASQEGQRTAQDNDTDRLGDGDRLPITIFGHTFADGWIGRDALTLSHDPIRRARFIKYKILGDAVLDYFLVEGLFTQHPTATPGSLTVMRHSRHGDSCLAAFCVVSGLVDQITDIPSDLMKGLQRYKRSVMAEKTAADACDDAAGKLEFWANIPLYGHLGEIVNVVFGAILVDSHYDIPLVRRVLTAHLSPFIEMYCVGPGETGPHPRTVWSEMIFKRGCAFWEMKKDERTERGAWVAVVYLHDLPIGRGESETPSLAIRKACAQAVKRCKGEALLDKVCTCPHRKKGKGGVLV